MKRVTDNQNPNHPNAKETEEGKASSYGGNTYNSDLSITETCITIHFAGLI